MPPAVEERAAAEVKGGEVRNDGPLMPNAGGACSEREAVLPLTPALCVVRPARLIDAAPSPPTDPAVPSPPRLEVRADEDDDCCCCCSVPLMLRVCV